MNVDWLAVFDALKAVYTEEAYSNIAVNEALSHHKGCRESFVRNFAKSVIRDSIKLDYYIDRLSRKGIESVDTRPLILLRMGIYAIYGLDSVPEHAAVNETVNLSKKVAKGSSAFINGMLRSYIRERDNLVIPEDRPDIKYSVNQGIINLLKKQYGDEAEDILKAVNEPSATIVRANRLRTTRAEVVYALRDMGVKAEMSKESPNAVIASGSGIIESDLYKKGLLSIHSLSSMMAIEALAPRSGSKVLDMCAAPGGKSAYMAELMDGKGSILACDIHEHKLKLIDGNMKRLGIDIVKTERRDAAAYDELLKESFDYVVCDVPCSGLGVMQSKPEIKFRSDPGSYPELIELQKAILTNAIRYAKDGGRIEYSSCTLNKDENEKAVKNVIQREKDSLLSIIEMHTFMPYNSKVGFFYCILEKNSRKGRG